MSGPITLATRGIVSFLDLLNVYDSIKSVNLNRGERMLEQASLVNRLILVGFSLAEAGAIAGGANNASLTVMKIVELLPRTFNLPLQLVKESLKYEHTPSGAATFIEKGILSPVADLTRIMAELSAYEETRYIEMSPEERAGAKRPIVEYMGEGDIRIVGYRPVDLEECQRNLSIAQGVITGSTFVRLGADLNTLSKGIKMGQICYERLARFLQNNHCRLPRRQCAQRNEPLRENQRAQEPQIQENHAPIEEVFHLLNLNMIPPALHNDGILRQFICPITQSPIRYPVGDPNGTTLYERSAIVNWLQVNPTSPMTRQPLGISALVERPGVQAIIDSRLRFHQTHLWEYVQQSSLFNENLNVTRESVLQAQVDQEINN